MHHSEENSLVNENVFRRVVRRKIIERYLRSEMRQIVRIKTFTVAELVSRVCARYEILDADEIADARQIADMLMRPPRTL